MRRPGFPAARLAVLPLEDRTAPAVVTGTGGNDVIFTRLLFAPGAAPGDLPTAAQVVVNKTVAATVPVTGAWYSPTVSYYLAEDLEIKGLGGNDRVSVGLVRPPEGSEIVVDGGAGNDTLVGGSGYDQLVGGPGQDDLDGGVGEDRLEGDADDVRLVGGGGVDALVGGAGVDTLLGSFGADLFRPDADPATAEQEALAWDFNPDEGDAVV